MSIRVGPRRDGRGHLAVRLGSCRVVFRVLRFRVFRVGPDTEFTKPQIAKEEPFAMCRADEAAAVR